MNEKLELFAFVELFGHNKIAGTVTEQSIGGASFVRIDVPETESQPSFTKMYHPNAIYAINPVTEDVMKYMAENFSVKPIDSWDIKKMNEKLLALGVDKNTSPVSPFSGNDDDDLDF